MKEQLRFFLTQSEIREVEQRAFQSGMPVDALVEKAGLILSRRIESMYPLPEFKKVTVFAGAGHNGADALVVARELLLAGYHVVVVEIDADAQRPLTKQLAAYFRRLGGTVVNGLLATHDCDVVIDGVMGFGLTKALAADVVQTIQGLKRPIVSIDLPSGMHPDRGVIGPCVQATCTLCLQFLKYSFCDDDAVDFIGELHCVDLGLSSFVTNHTVQENRVSLLLPERSQSSHKYSVGKVSLVVGSDAYKGAAILCALSCRETGIGYITVVSNNAEVLEILRAAPDVVCNATTDFSKDRCVLVGPGLGVDAKQLSELLETIHTNLVVDASALQPTLTKLLSARSQASIITPHAGEFGRMFPHLAHLSKIEMARRAAAESGAVVVLKGPRTVIAASNGQVRVQMESTPALARAGTGDVLAGLITGLVPLLNDAFEASCFAVRWHAKTAMQIENSQGASAVNAFSLVHSLSRTLFEEPL